MNRVILRKTCNNKENPNKSKCALKVTDVFGVSDKVKYLHTTSDVLRAIRTKFKAKRANTEYKVKRGLTIGKLKRVIKENDLLIVTTKDHILCLSSQNGEVLQVDTAPSDKRKVILIYRVTRKDVLIDYRTPLQLARGVFTHQPTH